jgi:phage tail tape-measure protein
VCWSAGGWNAGKLAGWSADVLAGWYAGVRCRGAQTEICWVLGCCRQRRRVGCLGTTCLRGNGRGERRRTRGHKREVQKEASSRARTVRSFGRWAALDGSPRLGRRGRAECRVLRAELPSAKCRVQRCRVPRMPSAKCRVAELPSAECRVPRAECRVQRSRVPKAESRVPSAEDQDPKAES